MFYRKRGSVVNQLGHLNEQRSKDCNLGLSKLKERKKKKKKAWASGFQSEFF